MSNWLSRLGVITLLLGGCGVADPGPSGDSTGGPDNGPKADSSASVRRLSIGHAHSCALAGDEILCWGLNDNGQLGDGTTTRRETPVVVQGGPYVELSSGDFHTCAVTAAGGVECWGRNRDGQLGDGTTSDRSLPTPGAGLEQGVPRV